MLAALQARIQVSRRDRNKERPNSNSSTESSLAHTQADRHFDKQLRRMPNRTYNGTGNKATVPLPEKREGAPWTLLGNPPGSYLETPRRSGVASSRQRLKAVPQASKRKREKRRGCANQKGAAGSEGWNGQMGLSGG